MSLWKVYEFERKLLDVCLAISKRGLLVDNGKRLKRIEQLNARAEPLARKAEEIVRPLLEKLKRPGLISKLKTCKGCRNGSKKKLSCEVCKGAGKFERFEFNLGSEAQLKDVLYNGLGLPVRMKDKKPSSDEEALQSLLALDSSGLVKLALEYAKLTTMKEIYERLEPGADGKIRTLLAPLAFTGRFTSRGAFFIPSSTNLQNLPEFEASRDPLFEVREIIVPGPGMVFLYADLSQAEARVTACLADDMELLERWKDSKWDVHRFTASMALGKKAEEITPTERFLYKTARHALNYGMGAKKFWREVNSKADMTGVAITLKEAQEIHKKYHLLHPKLRRWWGGVERKLLADGVMTTCFGRKAKLWVRIDENGGPDSDSLQTAIAYEPQSTVADILNEGLVRIFESEGLEYRVVLQVHDAVLVEVRSEAAGYVAKWMKESLEREIEINGHKLTIPAEVFLCRHSWGEKERVL